MTRTRRAAALLAVMAVGLASCQTTSDQQPSGAVAGGLVGAASSAGAVTGTAIAGGGFSGQNMLVGVLVGAVVGAIIGSQVFDGSAKPIPTLNEADQTLADGAAADAADAGIGQRVHWTSQTDDSISGWSEAYLVDEPVAGQDCREARMYYAFGERARVETKVFCRKDGQWVSS